MRELDNQHREADEHGAAVSSVGGLDSLVTASARVSARRRYEPAQLPDDPAEGLLAPGHR
jgi:hypothetical protein